jgi:hypothetical protein
VILDTLLQFGAVQQISLPDIDAALELLQPPWRTNKCCHAVAAFDCLPYDFQSSAARGAQHNQSQALPGFTISGVAIFSMVPHVGYR